MSDIKDILDRQSQLETARAPEEAIWRELAATLMPDERAFNANEKHPTRDEVDIFDATQLYARDDFAKGLFKQATNPANRWFELGLVDKDLQKFGPVKNWLYATTAIVYASLSPTTSRFYSAAQPWFANVGAFGWGPLWQEERIGTGRISDRALPIGQVYLDVDDDGLINTVHRKFSRKGRQIKQKFGAVDVEDNRDYVIVHAVYPNPEADPRKLGPRFMAFRSCYVSSDMPEFMRQGGYEELPCHIPFWNERSNSAYPTGPGHDARADIATLQEMERSNLVMGQFAAEPPVLLHDDAPFTAADIVPNGTLYGAMNDQGKANVGYLDRKAQPVISLQMAEQKRTAIRRAFAFSMAQIIDRPQMTATEFSGWEQQQLEQAAPNLVNLQIGGLSPFLQRRLHILKRAGMLPPPPPELIGNNMEIEYVSPLAKAQKIGTARSAVGWVTSALMPLAEVRPEVLDNLDVDGYARVTHDGMSGIPQLIRDQADVDKTRQARADAQAQQQKIEQASQMAAIYADASHAQQANTLANGRSGKAA